MDAIQAELLGILGTSIVGVTASYFKYKGAIAKMNGLPEKFTKEVERRRKFERNMDRVVEFIELDTLNASPSQFNEHKKEILAEIRTALRET